MAKIESIYVALSFILSDVMYDNLLHPFSVEISTD